MIILSVDVMLGVSNYITKY